MRWPRPMRLYSVYTQNTDPTYTQYGRARGRSSCLSLPSTQESGEERADELPALERRGKRCGETERTCRRRWWLYDFGPLREVASGASAV